MNDKSRDLTLRESRGMIDKEQLTKAQLDFLEFCERYGWGKLEVTIKHGEPVMSRELEHDHKHD